MPDMESLKKIIGSLLLEVLFIKGRLEKVEEVLFKVSETLEKKTSEKPGEGTQGKTTPAPGERL
jgi:hypothetical protein